MYLFIYQLSTYQISILYLVFRYSLKYKLLKNFFEGCLYIMLQIPVYIIGALWDTLWCLSGENLTSGGRGRRGSPRVGQKRRNSWGGSQSSA